MWWKAAIASAAWTTLLVVLYTVPGPTVVPGAIVGWTLLAGSAVTLRKGARYRACVNIPIFTPSAAEVKERLEREGFRDVFVSYKSAPTGWTTKDCEYFIEATWGQSDRPVSRPGAVKHAWEATTS